MTILSPELLSHLASQSYVVLTKVRLKVKPRLGSYSLDIDAKFQENVAALVEDDALGAIEEIHGIAYTPDLERRFAFRVTPQGTFVAANADQEALEEVEPKLRAVLAKAG